MKWQFYPLRDDIAAGLLKRSGCRPVIAEFLTPAEAKNLRLRELQRLRGK